jgi:hypothetical protein
LVLLLIVLAIYLGLLQLVVYWARRISRDDGAPTAPVGVGPPAG